MLPLPVQFLISLVVSAFKERMARRFESLHEENPVLRELFTEVTGRKRIPFCDDQRRRLAIKGKQLTVAERKACCRTVSPQTLIDWFRELAAKKYDSSTKRKPGRPRTKQDIRELVIRLAKENPGWRYTKIRDALWGPKHDIARSTVASILEEAGIEPEPERSRKRTWKQFLESHWDTLYACDFFTVETLGAFGAVRIHDRDPLFSKAWRSMLADEGVQCVPIPRSSPDCNPHAERFVRSIRNECLNHFVILGERHRRHLLREDIVHYNAERFHQGLGGSLITEHDAPGNDNGISDVVQRRKRLGGILNFYHRKAA